jgi:putative transcriptional regulator
MVAPRDGAASLSDSISDLPETAAHMPAGSVLERLGMDASLGLTSVETASLLARFGPTTCVSRSIGETCKATLTATPCQANLTAVQNDVRKLREDRSLSQGDLARQLGVSRQTVNAIETGRYLPSLPLAMAIGRYFGRAVEEVFRDDERSLGAQ